MSIMVVGSLAFDTVKTPYGEVKDALGGAATYFSLAASYFSPVSVVAVVGEDFGDEHLEVLKRHGVDTSGVERVAGRSFRWGGEYSWNLNQRTTLFTELNVFEDFDPKLPAGLRKLPYVFLANIDPGLQRSVLEQVESPELVACDTMNYWIERNPDELRALLGQVDVLVINDDEARELAGEYNLVEAAAAIRALGPSALIIKRGEHGALAFFGAEMFSAPGFPLEKVADPTGAGDSFAGGFMGYIAKHGEAGATALRRAVIAGSVMASFCVERFSVEGLCDLDGEQIARRYRAFQLLTDFGDF
jgi:sugar/nucleoside kinase (ribokinase family)